MLSMDDLSWDRCPDCLGLLEAVDAAGRTALACPLCGFIGALVEVPDRPRPSDDGVDALPGW